MLGSNEAGGEASFSISAYLLSFWLSGHFFSWTKFEPKFWGHADIVTGPAAGGKVAFVWDIIRRVCGGIEGPLVLLVRDVEQTVCGSHNAYDGFAEAFGTLGRKLRPPQTGMATSLMRRRPPLVLIGGCSLNDTGSHLTSAGHGSALIFMHHLSCGESKAKKLLHDHGRVPAEKAAMGKGAGIPAGADDSFSLLPELGIAIQEDVPNPQRHVTATDVNNAAIMESKDIKPNCAQAVANAIHDEGEA